MFLARALNNVFNITRSIDRQKVLVETLKNPEKLAKTILRIEFLTACRRAKVSPRFITDALKPIDKIFIGNDSVQSRCNNFKSSLLNESISEAFRRKSYLLRQRARLFAHIETFLDENHLSYISVTCGQVFDLTVHENRPRLVKKFQDLVKEEPPAEELNKLKSPVTGQRVNNLSSLTLTDHDLKLLSKGPNFAITQMITKETVLEAGKGAERLAYAKRWQDEIKRTNEMKRNAAKNIHQPTPTSTTMARGDIPAADTAQPGGTRATTAVGAPGDSASAARTTPGGSPAAAGTAGTADMESSSEPNGITIGKPASAKEGLSFRFPDTDKRLPPPSDVDVECKLRQLKKDIVRSYKNHKVTSSNVSQKQLEFLDELKKNENIVIKQSDKCKGLVLMDKCDYLNKSHAILSDRDNYEIMHKNPVAKVEAESKRIFKAVSKDKLPDLTVKELTPCHSRIPVFYGIPKDHKEGVPLRPVISACGGPTEKMSCLLERVLKQLLRFVPTHLWDTGDFLTRLGTHSEEHGIPEGSIFFSIDVVNLYGSIPISEAIDAVCETLEAHLQEVNMFGLELDDVRTLLEHCLQKNVFSFQNEFYRQTLGIAMGNPCAPPIAILFLDRFERLAWEAIGVKPAFIVRYIDDYAGIWTHGEQALVDFLAHLNALHPNLRFTLEHSGGGGQGVPFLDTLVTVEENNGITKIETELFIKPMNSGIILNHDSAHPSSTKHNVARNQFRRAIRNSSNANKEKRSIDKIRRLLLENGYPRKLLDRLLREVRMNDTSTRRRNAKQQERFDGFLCLPYVDEQLLCKIKSRVKKSGLNVKIAWKNTHKLKDKLVHSSLWRPDCPQKNIIYQLTCKVCEENSQK